MGRVALVALLLAAPAAAQDPWQRTETLRGEGRYREALEASADIEDDPARARARLLVRYSAGDMAGTFAEGQKGLEVAPEDLWLLYYTTRVAIDLGVPEHAVALSDRLVSATASNSELSAGDRDFYRTAGDEFSAAAGSLAKKLDDRSRALGLAKTTVLASALMALGALLWLGRRA